MSARRIKGTRMVRDSNGCLWDERHYRELIVDIEAMNGRQIKLEDVPIEDDCTITKPEKKT